jgi:hypothetical protein
MIQSMQKFYIPLLLISALFLGWAHTHTDEIPIVLGIVLIVSGVVGILFPRHAVISILVLGPAIFCAETLVHFGVLRAPYPPSNGLPWAALAGFVPAAIGVGVGAMVRRTMFMTE